MSSGETSRILLHLVTEIALVFFKSSPRPLAAHLALAPRATYVEGLTMAACLLAKFKLYVAEMLGFRAEAVNTLSSAEGGTPMPACAAEAALAHDIVTGGGGSLRNRLGRGLL